MVCKLQLRHCQFFAFGFILPSERTQPLVISDPYQKCLNLSSLSHALPLHIPFSLLLDLLTSLSCWPLWRDLRQSTKDIRQKFITTKSKIKMNVLLWSYLSCLHAEIKDGRAVMTRNVLNCKQWKEGSSKARIDTNQSARELNFVCFCSFSILIQVLKGSYSTWVSNHTSMEAGGL